MELSIRTFSYDARLIKIFPLYTGWQLVFRSDCNGFIPVISEDGPDCIYVTNKEVFDRDIVKFINNDVGYRGMQFTAVMDDGLLLTSYTYEEGSMRSGGFSNYALK